MKYRALTDLSIRKDKGDGFLNVKAGEEFTPPKRMAIAQSIERGYIEEVKDNE